MAYYSPPPTTQITREAEPCIDAHTKEIADRVRQEIAVASRNAIAVTGAEEAHSIEELGPSLSRADVIGLCQQLASVCMQYGGDAQLSLELLQHLDRYSTALRQEELRDSRQTTLDEYFTAG